MPLIVDYRIVSTMPEVYHALGRLVECLSVSVKGIKPPRSRWRLKGLAMLRVHSVIESLDSL